MNYCLRRHHQSLSYKGLCLLLAGLTGCATTPSLTSSRPAGARSGSSGADVVTSWGFSRDESKASTDPKIEPGYLLTLHCPTDSKLDGDFRVEFDGNLSLPYDVTLKTNGYTLSELRKKLLELYRSNFKTAPDIEVKIKEQRYWLDVRGLVDKPGRYLVDPDASLDSIIGSAGGLTKEPAPDYVRIQKDSKLMIVDLKRYYAGENEAQILSWLGGEVLFFQQGSRGPLGSKSMSSSGGRLVYLIGEVRKPGEYPLSPGTDFVDMLVQAGGFTERADLDHIEIIRPTMDGKLDLRYSWSDLRKAPPPVEGDVIMIHADRTPASERKVTLFTAIVGTLASVVTSTIIVLSYNRGRF